MSHEDLLLPPNANFMPTVSLLEAIKPYTVLTLNTSIFDVSLALFLSTVLKAICQVSSERDKFIS